MTEQYLTRRQRREMERRGELAAAGDARVAPVEGGVASSDEVHAPETTPQASETSPVPVSGTIPTEPVAEPLLAGPLFADSMHGQQPPVRNPDVSRVPAASPQTAPTFPPSPPEEHFLTRRERRERERRARGESQTAQVQTPVPATTDGDAAEVAPAAGPSVELALGQESIVDTPSTGVASHRDPEAAAYPSDGTDSVIVLPHMPDDQDLRGPLDETGETILTGTIALPRSLATTGVIPTGLEEKDDPAEHGGFAIGATNRPVPAKEVVAEVTASRVLPTARSTRGLAIVLGAVAAGLVLVAVGMLVYYFVVAG